MSLTDEIEWINVQPIVLCPKTEQVKQGERGLISCNVTGDPKPNITWTKETQPGKVISYNSTLVIDNASIFDEEKYNITANNGRSASVLVELEVIFPPSVEISNKTATAVEGDRLNFTCAASGKPEPKITWTKVGSAEVIAHTPSVSVIVERLWTRDSINQYRCTASNGVGIPATATVSVIVLSLSLMAFKIKVTTEVEAVENNSKIAQEYGLSEPMVRCWRTDNATILLGERKMSAKCATMGRFTLKYPELDQQVMEWFSQQREQGIAVSGLMLHLKAKELSDDPCFKASRGWYEKWKRRHSVSMRTKTTLAQRLPADLEENIVCFHRFVIAARRRADYPLSRIYNMDETPMCFELSSNQTLEFGPFEFTPAGKKVPSRSLVLSWIKEAWAEIPQEMVIKSFKTCSISSALDGTEETSEGDDEDIEENEFETDSEKETDGK
ncbi:Pogo transposable element with KRAB domain [Stylophora pistillata]|uniref:Pogo transposable element with KRAB domain n=1 Tax=Stylophora pistillata TaxID=50429 RepID=A0A2B4S2V4_STYPI|nr:Pogo transposable element with KRAB domain [Stylophora pistillata]